MFSLPQQKAGTARSVKNDRPGTGDSGYERSVAFCPHCYAMICVASLQRPALCRLKFPDLRENTGNFGALKPSTPR